MTSNTWLNHLHRELSIAEKAQVIGFYRQSQNIIMVMGVMEISKESAEAVIQDYFGGKLAKQEKEIV